MPTNLTHTATNTKEVLEAIPHGVMVIDPDDTIIAINHTVANLLQCQKADLINKPFKKCGLTFQTPDEKDLPYTQLAHQQVLKTKQPVSQQEVLLPKNRTILSLNAQPIIKDDQLISIIVSLQDITKFKQIQEQQSQFIRTIGHELKHPLTNIKAYLYFLKKGLKDTDLTQYLQKIDRQTDLLNQMLNDLSDVSRISLKQLQIEAKPLNFSQLIKEVIEELQSVHRHHTLKLKTLENVWVKGDDLRLTQVITNLISNAVKYSEKSTTISVKLSHKDSQAKLAITDQGPGIKKADQKRIFMPYLRTESAQKKSVKGLGLGLYLSKIILHQHDGDINVDSQVGKGSTFTVSLPTTPPPQKD